MPGRAQTEVAYAHGQAASLAVTVPSFSARKAVGVFHPRDWWGRRSLYRVRQAVRAPRNSSAALPVAQPHDLLLHRPDDALDDAALPVGRPTGAYVCSRSSASSFSGTPTANGGGKARHRAPPARPSAPRSAARAGALAEAAAQDQLREGGPSLGGAANATLAARGKALLRDASSAVWRATAPLAHNFKRGMKVTHPTSGVVKGTRMGAAGGDEGGPPRGGRSYEGHRRGRLSSVQPRSASTEARAGSWYSPSNCPEPSLANFPSLARLDRACVHDPCGQELQRQRLLRCRRPSYSPILRAQIPSAKPGAARRQALAPYSFARSESTVGPLQRTKEICRHRGRWRTGSRCGRRYRAAPAPGRTPASEVKAHIDGNEQERGIRPTNQQPI